LIRQDRRVGATADPPEEWIEAVKQATMPEESAHLDAELK
jgi:hypothetical protein